jgi:hypothetical protein
MSLWTFVTNHAVVPNFILLDQTKNGERREIPINSTLRETLGKLFRGTKERPRRIGIPWCSMIQLQASPIRA